VRLESLDAQAPPIDIGRGFSVIVDDGTATDLTLKGDGVQSLAALALTQHYSRERARAREFILAVEEPEAHLHPRAIHRLRDTLRETASTQQVIITTHSPLFVNRLDLSSNIIVRKNRAQPGRSVQELREA
jgi:putative ATP-dependent endonuclease of the OLD family